MPDRVDQWLDSCSAPACPEPPAAFLGAVGRRRRSRRLKQAGGVAVLVLAIAGGMVLLNQGSRMRTEGGRRAAAVPSADATALALARMNLSRDPENLILPETGAADGDRPIRLGARWDPARVEQWVSR